jgi:hypothetical protein
MTSIARLAKENTVNIDTLRNSQEHAWTIANLVMIVLVTATLAYLSVG